MTIAEAVEIVKSDSVPSLGQDFIARSILADAYLRLTDATPLTRELIEKELGAGDLRCTAKGYSLSWFEHAIIKYQGEPCARCGPLRLTTLGDLRHIVRMLRRGA